MFIPGYHNSYPPIIDAYGNRRDWGAYRGAFVGTHSAPGLGGGSYYRIADVATHDARVGMALQDAVPMETESHRLARRFAGPVGYHPPAEEKSSNVPLIVGGVVAVTLVGLLLLAVR